MEISTPLLYVSGMSSKSDFAGTAAAGVPIGTQINEVSKAVVSQMVKYNAVGGKIFVDSGAFTAFRKGLTLDFDDILDRYDALAAVMKNPRNIAFVAPDVIGDMEETARLQNTYLGRLKSLAAKGVEIMLPFQKGWEPAAYARHEKALRREIGAFTVAFACNEKAWSPQEIAEVVCRIRPKRVHLLGAGKKMVLRYCQSIAEVSARTVVSADANRLRAFIGTGRPLTEQVKMSTENANKDMSAFLDRSYDDTEILHDLYNTPGFLDPGEAMALAKCLGIANREELSRWAESSQECADEDEPYSCKLGNLLDAGGYGGIAVRMLVEAREGQAIRAILIDSEVGRTRISSRVENIKTIMDRDQHAIAREFASTRSQLAFDFFFQQGSGQRLAA